MLISFHGSLKNYGSFDIQAGTPAQALGIIFAQMPELASKIRQGAYKVFFDGSRLDELEFEHRAHWKDAAKHIRIIPVLEGAKSDGVGKVILGVVLIGAAILTSGVLAGAGFAALTGGMSGLAFKLGVGLVLAGVGSLLAPKEKEPEDTDDTESFAWNGPTTRAGQGHPLPMIYGHVRTGGHIININTDVVQLLNKQAEDLTAQISDFKARLDITHFKKKVENRSFFSSGKGYRKPPITYEQYVRVAVAWNAKNITAGDIAEISGLTAGANSSRITGSGGKSYQSVSTSDADNQVVRAAATTKLVVKEYKKAAFDKIGNITVKLSRPTDPHMLIPVITLTKEKKNIWIKGAKGSSSSSSRSANIAPNSLHSKSIVNLTYGLSTGPIVGVIRRSQGEGYKWLNGDTVKDYIYFGGTKSRGNYSFNYQERMGYPYQNALRGNTNIENDRSVDMEATMETKPSHTISDKAVDYIEIGVYIPSLVRMSDKGDQSAATIEFAIDMKIDNGAWFYWAGRRIHEKTMSPQDLEYRIHRPNFKNEWSVRIRRLTPMPKDDKIQNAIYIKRFTEGSWKKYRYPSLAVTNIEIDSSDFQSLPSVNFDVQGRIIRVPSNYNPNTGTYSGIWNGTFKQRYCTNPAWVMLDILTSPSYEGGMGLSDAQIDLGRLYQIAVYCDKKVPDGYGSWERRYSCNGIIDSEYQPLELLQKIAAIWRGGVYLSARGLSFTCDMPSSPIIDVTPANAIDGTFTWTKGEIDDQVNSVAVRYNDPSNDFVPELEVIQDNQSVAKDGLNHMQIDAFMCTTRGRAHREAQWVLYTQKYENETVSWKASLDHIITNGFGVEPGDIVSIHDPARTGISLGGRIISASSTQIVLDRPVPLDANCRLWYQTENGRVSIKPSNQGLTSVVKGNIKDIPKAGYVWMLEKGNIKPRLVRISKVITPENESHLREFHGVLHNPSKYDYIEKDHRLSIPNYDRGYPTGPLAKPKNLQAKSYLAKENDVCKGKLVVSWSKPDDIRAASFVIKYKHAGDHRWIIKDLGDDSDYIIDNAKDGAYTIYVQSKSNLGKFSAWSKIIHNVRIFSPLPQNVHHFQATQNGGSINLTWSHVADLDLAGYVIRYSPLKHAIWEQASEIGTIIKNDWISLPSRAGTYLIKAQDTTGGRSLIAAKVVVDGIIDKSENIIHTWSEKDRGFTGFKYKLEHEDHQGLFLTSRNTAHEWDDIHLINNIHGTDNNLYDWDNIYSIYNIHGDFAKYGIYTLKDTTDLKGIMAVNITGSMICRSNLLNNDLHSWGNIYITDNIHGEYDGSWRAHLEINHSSDGNNWSGWKELTTDQINLRYAKFRAIIDVDDDQNTTPIIEDIRINMDLPEYVLDGKDIPVSSKGLYIRFKQAFWRLTSLAVTAEEINENIFYKITQKSNEGFFIQFFNKSKQPIAGRIDWQAMGIGLKKE